LVTSLHSKPFDFLIEKLFHNFVKKHKTNDNSSATGYETHELIHSKHLHWVNSNTKFIKLFLIQEQKKTTIIIFHFKFFHQNSWCIQISLHVVPSIHYSMRILQIFQADREIFSLWCLHTWFFDQDVRNQRPRRILMIPVGVSLGMFACSGMQTWIQPGKRYSQFSIFQLESFHKLKDEKETIKKDSIIGHYFVWNLKMLVFKVGYGWMEESIDKILISSQQKPRSVEEFPW